MEATAIMGLEQRGWSRGRPGNSGVISTFTKPVATGEAELSFEEGWYTGERPHGAHTLGLVTLRGLSCWADLDAVSFSELVRDLIAARSVNPSSEAQA